MLYVSVFDCVYCRLLIFVLCVAANNIFFACTVSVVAVAIVVHRLPRWLCTFLHAFAASVRYGENVFRVFSFCHCINIIFSSHHIVSTLLFPPVVRMCFTFHKCHIIHIYFIFYSSFTLFVVFRSSHIRSLMHIQT